MSAYIASLNKLIAAERVERVASGGTLGERITRWHRSLPEVTRHRPFAMSEFEAALSTQGKYISAALLELGWQRRRVWSTAGSYYRYWMPPES